MENATILKHPSTVLSGILPLSEPNIPEGPEYEKISTLYRCVLLTPHRNNDSFGVSIG